MAEVTVRLPEAPPEAYVRYLAWWEALDRFMHEDPSVLGETPAPGGLAATGAVRSLALAHVEQLRTQATAALNEGREGVSPLLRGDPLTWRIALSQAARLSAWLDQRAAEGRPVPAPDPDLAELRQRVLAVIRRGLASAEGPVRMEPEAEPGSYRLVGEVDMTNADQVTSVLESDMDAGYRITLDLSGLTFMDSTGIRMLIRLARHAQTREAAPIVLVSPSPPIERILGLTVPDGIPGMEIRTEGGSGGPGPQPLLFFCL